MSYSARDVERLLREMFTGSPASRPAVEPGMPRSKSNPAHGGDDIVERVDIELAYNALRRDSLWSPEALYLRLGNDELIADVAEELGVTPEEVAAGVEADVHRITNYLNGVGE